MQEDCTLAVNEHPLSSSEVKVNECVRQTVHEAFICCAGREGKKLESSQQSVFVLPDNEIPHNATRFPSFPFSGEKGDEKRAKNFFSSRCDIRNKSVLSAVSNAVLRQRGCID